VKKKKKEKKQKNFWPPCIHWGAEKKKAGPPVKKNKIRKFPLKCKQRG